MATAQNILKIKVYNLCDYEVCRNGEGIQYEK